MFNIFITLWEKKPNYIGLRHRRISSACRYLEDYHKILYNMELFSEENYAIKCRSYTCRQSSCGNSERCDFFTSVLMSSSQ